MWSESIKGNNQANNCQSNGDEHRGDVNHDEHRDETNLNENTEPLHEINPNEHSQHMSEEYRLPIIPNDSNEHRVNLNATMPIQYLKMCI